MMIYAYRRTRNRLAVEDALFRVGRGTAQDIADDAGCVLTTAIMHLKGMADDGLAQWNKLFLPVDGPERYAGGARVYSLTKTGRTVIDARHVLEDDVRYQLLEAPRIPLADCFEGLGQLIRTGYMELGAETEGKDGQERQ